MEKTHHHRHGLNEFLPAEARDYPIRNDRYIALENRAVSFLTLQRWIQPNHITVFRFAVAGVLLWFSESISYPNMLILVAVGGLSDFLDGAFARAASKKTRLGMILDPLADKFLVFGIIYVLIVRQAIDPMIVLLMIAVEGHVVMVPLLSFKGKWRRGSLGSSSRPGKGDWYSLPIASQAALPGKIKFMLYAFGLMAVLLGNACQSHTIQRIGTGLLILGIASGAVAFAKYVIRWWRAAPDFRIQQTSRKDA